MYRQISQTFLTSKEIILKKKLFILFILLLLAYPPLPLISEIEDIEEQKKQKANTSENRESQQKSSQKGAEEAEQTLKIGNLAFPPSQQPSPLISFGQNIINQKQTLAQLAINEFKGENQYFINLSPSILYAFTDSFSLFLVAPIAVRYKQQHHHSSGPEDAIIQLEYAFYTKSSRTFYDQATIVANITFPTGSTKKNPPTGIGSNSFFLGSTYSRMAINWFYFVSSGAVWTTPSHKTQFGNQYLYQFGLGRRIFSTSRWLFDWMIELDGTYSEKNRIRGRIDPNSGGNVIYMTPSLWISSKESFFVQFGIGVAIQQNLFGKQKKNHYLLILNSGWLF